MATTTERESARVSLQLSVAVPEECPLSGLEGEIVSTDRQMVEDGCHSIFVVRPDTGDLDAVEWRHDLTRHTGTCLCHVFCEEGVMPIFDRVADGRVHISVFLKEEMKARSLYESLSELVSDVEIRRLNTNGNPCHMNSLTKVNLAELTEKQTVALEIAVAGGYYEEPKETTITELAETVGISRQAFSHRLKEAEREVFQQVLSGSR